MPRGRRFRLFGETSQHRAALLRFADVASSLSRRNEAVDANAPVNILLVDDQPAKLLSYEAILSGLGENLIKATSAREALERLLTSEIAVILVDVCMPELDGFEFARMVREHPRFQETAIIFVSAVLLTEVDALRGYEMGAVDYVPVPVVPEVLRAKVKVFAELYRKTKQLETLNRRLEQRVAERTSELEAANTRLIQSEQLRSLALAAGQMGSWDWDLATDHSTWDDGQCRIFGVDPESFRATRDSVLPLILEEDLPLFDETIRMAPEDARILQAKFRVRRPSGEIRSCIGIAAAERDADGTITRLSGVTVDMTDLEKAQEHQLLLAREVDHRAKNALAVVQAIVRLTRADSLSAYVTAIEGRIGALSRAHALLASSRWEGAKLESLVEQELAPYRTKVGEKIAAGGPDIVLPPAIGQTIGLALHELATNAAKYGALSALSGKIDLTWGLEAGRLVLNWVEHGGPSPSAPKVLGYGIRTITAAFERQMQGDVTFKWLPRGLHCRLSLPFGARSVLMSATGIGPRRAADGAHAAPLVPKGNRLLLVEDEVLVATMMTEALGEIGFEILGPFGKMDYRLGAAIAGDIDAAILDVNIGGELVYPIAEILAARAIPFAFVTGYSEENIDRRFAHVPVMQKP
ncbi:MAG: response regulator, partial [Hyphomicrobiales bacterium]|nr:response regulator [Hyphomicrobiales bacterium]